MQRLLSLVLFFFFAASAFCADTYLVLPFFNLTNSQNLDWVGESIAESVRENLDAEGNLVLDRGERQDALRRLSIRPYAQLTLASLVKLGEEVDAEQVIYGQFQLSQTDPSGPQNKANIVITSGILDLRHLKRGQPVTTTGPLESLTALQTHLSWMILKSLGAQSSSDEAEFRMVRPPVRVDAMENYIRGLLAPTLESKQKFFQTAYRLDNRFSQACYQLGKLNWERKNYKVAAEWFQKVGTSDVRFRESYFLMGLCLYYTGSYPAAEKAFQFIAQSVPLNEVYNNLGAAQSRENSPQALDNFRRALEGDPSDTAYQFNVGFALWRRGNFAEAADRFRAVLDRTSDDQQAMLLLGKCLKQNGPKPNDPSPGLERVKENYEESAYRQLKAVLAPKK